ncbi:universal stress protein [Halosolutus halophilus]|uniref:universal stress protein n=1 Tax=Halosolutus halophilus TaxID=1552990 RepID=UPI0022351F9E|nr:universal stress protein [Halosolutus halophilus]
MSRQLLVPVDGSPLSNRALEYAFDAHEDPSVVALHVIDPADPGYSSMIDVDVRNEPPHGSDEWYERATKEEERLFSEARDLAAERDAELSTESVVGDPSRKIVDYAEDHDVDAIVMGSHGRSGPTRLLLGSTAELVVSRAPVTVTVVRDEVDRGSPD